MNSDFDPNKEVGLTSLPYYSSESTSALLCAREVLQSHLTAVYSVKSCEGVEELKPINIGGVDQWLHIRGRNRKNPILLYLHGGPGSPMIGMMDAIQRPWEDYFNIVHWDQRQTGKSYYPADDDKNPVTVQHFIEDAEDLVQYLRHYFGREKIFLLGHSWGSVIGIHLAKRNPEWFYAYVGVEQIVNTLAAEGLMYERALTKAEEQCDGEWVAKLRSIEPYLDPTNRCVSFADNWELVRKALSYLGGEAGMHHLYWEDLIKMLSLEQFISPHLTFEDIKNSAFGGDIAVFRPPYAFTKEFLSIDLPNEVGSVFEVPIFFFTGAHDWQTPKVLSDKWFGKIKAPYKELVSFEDSCHVIINEEPGKFLVALVRGILPLSKM